MSYKMKYKKSAFPFKSPVKQQQKPTAPRDLNYGHDEWVRSQGGDPNRDMWVRKEEPTPTPKEYETQGLNRWGGTDMSI